MLNTIKSYAKINLFLNVVDKLDTGFHELNSVLSRIDLYDEIRIKDESSFSISYNGPFGDQVGSNDHISKLFNYLIDKNYLKQKSFATQQIWVKTLIGKLFIKMLKNLELKILSSRI